MTEQLSKPRSGVTNGPRYVLWRIPDNPEAEIRCVPEEDWEPVRPVTMSSYVELVATLLGDKEMYDSQPLPLEVDS